MAVLAGLGILGAIGWLLIAKKPIVNLAVFNDRNFAMGSVCIAATGAVLYAGAVVIPQFAQRVIGYTATWAGLILSPGGVVVILLIPIVGQLMRVIQIAPHHSRRLLDHGFGVCLLEHARAQYRFFDAGPHARRTDRRTSFPFRADQHNRLLDLAARAE